MDAMQEILETVREIRKSQIEALEWRRQYFRKVRIFSFIFAIIFAAYLLWAFRII